MILVAVLGLGAVFAVAQRAGHNSEGGKGRHFGGHKAGKHGIGMALRGLDLTDEQKAKVKELTDAHKATVEPIKVAVKESRIKMNAATANGAFDEAQVSAIATEQAGLMAKLVVEKERLKAQVHTLLTDDQKAKLAERKAKMEERMKDRQQRKAEKAGE